MTLEHRQNSCFPVALCLRVSIRQHRQNPIKLLVNNSHICLIPQRCQSTIPKVFSPLSPGTYSLIGDSLCVLLSHLWNFQILSDSRQPAPPLLVPRTNHPVISRLSTLHSYGHESLDYSFGTDSCAFLHYLPFFECINLNSLKPAASPLKVTVYAVGQSAFSTEPCTEGVLETCFVAA